jgi:hypothetical protein
MARNGAYRRPTAPGVSAIYLSPRTDPYAGFRHQLTEASGSGLIMHWFVAHVTVGGGADGFVTLKTAKLDAKSIGGEDR